MRAQILKIAGVKNDKEFYKKFPTEDAFMKKHGKAFKKAQEGMKVATPNNVSQDNLIPIGQEGLMSKIPGIGSLGNIVSGAMGIWGKGGEKDQAVQAKQTRMVSDINMDAAMMTPEKIEREYVRPEDTISTGEELFPVQGVGTNILQAQDGFFGKTAGLGNLGSNIASNFIDPNAGGTLGKGIGGALGSLIPGGSEIGGMVGEIAGNLLDPYAKKIKKENKKTDHNMGRMSGMGVGSKVQQMNNSFIQNGGKMQSGNVQTLWGGEAEAVAPNPFLGGDGASVEFKGNMHNGNPTPGKSGIGANIAGNQVEVEDGETLSMLQNGGGEEAVIFGNLNIPKGMLEDPLARGKFKNYDKKLNKETESVNKIKDRSLKAIDELTPIVSREKLAHNTHSLNVKGSDTKLKGIAERKQLAGQLQNTISETAEEMNLDANALAKGKYKKASKKFVPSNVSQDGNTLPVYQDGKFNEILPSIPADISARFGGSEGRMHTIQSQGQGIVDDYDGSGDYMDNDKWAAWLQTPDGQAYTAKHTRGKVDSLKYHSAGLQPMESSKTIDSPGMLGHTPGAPSPEEKGDGLKPWIQGLGSLIPKVLPSDQSPLDRSQLMGEMYAMSHNKLEPVKSQRYNPNLGTPMDISFQDQLNEINSSSRATSRMVGNNASAQSMLQGQRNKSTTGVLANQFRANQAEKQRVFEGNRNTLNDAQLKNLAIDDQQYVRQEQAKSNTKSTMQAALNSMTDKMAKNKLENRELAVMENMYNYRFGSNGRIHNMNGPAVFNTNVPGTTTNTTTKPGLSTPGIVSQNGSRFKSNGDFIKSLKRY